MISEEEYRQVWKEIYAEAAEHGGQTPGPRPITKPGVYEFIWVDDYGYRHVYTMWVIESEKRRVI
jgi:effector-binding domain-containing protein